MRDYLKSLSPAAEFTIVIVGAFGIFIFASVVQAWYTRNFFILVPSLETVPIGWGLDPV